MYLMYVWLKHFSFPFASTELPSRRHQHQHQRQRCHLRSNTTTDTLPASTNCQPNCLPPGVLACATCCVDPIVFPTACSYHDPPGHLRRPSLRLAVTCTCTSPNALPAAAPDAAYSPLTLHTNKLSDRTASRESPRFIRPSKLYPTYTLLGSSRK